MGLIFRFGRILLVVILLQIDGSAEQQTQDEVTTTAYPFGMPPSIIYPKRGIGMQNIGRVIDTSEVGVATPQEQGNDAPKDNPMFSALKRAILWTKDQRMADWGWGSDTPHTVLALSLSDPTFFSSRSLEAQLVQKQFDLQLVLRLWKHKDMPMTAGQLALNVMVLVALCGDPRNFYSKDLIGLLEHSEPRVDFEVAFTTLGACTAGRHIRKSRIRNLLDIMLDQSKIHSIDTLSVIILALHCAQRQQRHELRRYIDESIQILLQQQSEDGSFASNLHTTAIALQALTASGLGASWNATRAQQYVMSHQLPNGSFGNLFDTNAILPLLGGRSLLNVIDMPCRDQKMADVFRFGQEGNAYLAENELSPDPTHPSPSSQDSESNHTETTRPMINMTYIIWIGNAPTVIHNMTFTVPANTTFMEIMKMAAEEDSSFEFSASKWRNGYYVHTLSGQKETKVGYWYWLLFKLKEPPIPGTKPDNKFVVPLGIQELKPENGDYILFWFHKI